MEVIRPATPRIQGAASRMAYGAHHSPFPSPHPDLGLARDCAQCLGWGTVVTRDGDHELCHMCQDVPGDDEGTVRYDA